MSDTPIIQNAQQIKDIIEPIPTEKFIQGYYGDNQGNSCFLGHIHRALSTDGNYWGDGDGFGARELTKKFIEEKHGLNADGAEVNNYPIVNGYTEHMIKDRIMHLINDMISAGY